MLRMVELFIICVTLVATGNSAPWSENNDLREYDLEWQCEQLCERLYGKSIYNENNSTCSCNIDHDDPEINWKRIKNNARNLGLILEIINSHSKNIIKRETPAERLKNFLESKKQEIATANENDVLGKEGIKFENKNEILPAPVPQIALPESDRIKKLKELIQNKKAKINMNVDNDKLTEIQNDENIKPSPVKINLPINIAKNKKVDSNPLLIAINNKKNQEQTKTEDKLSLIDRLKLKKATMEANEASKLSDEPHLSRTEMFLEKRRKLREQLKERLLAARNRNKIPESK